MTLEIVPLPQEQQIRNLLAKGETKKATLFLQKMIADMARVRKFHAAERLRELLIEIDPMALADIIMAAEIIEKEKAAAVDKQHMTIWLSLVNILETNEFLTLYHSLEHRLVPKGEIIVKQSTQDSSLYFINSGQIELYFPENGNDILVKFIRPGEILGSDTFFESSVWTINARSLGAEISTLKFDQLQRWQKDFPGLESKLHDFCSKFKIDPESFKKMGHDRRIFERARVDGKIDMLLLNNEGKNTGLGAKGRLFDLSAGGVSFFLRITKKSNARLLLKKNVGLKMALPPTVGFGITGEIVAVRSQPVVGGEYAVCVQFSRLLSQRELQNLIIVLRRLKART